jgi:hypothetical protein
MHLECGSFLTPAAQATWLDADLIFANSTCFPDSLLLDIEQIAKGMRVGARIITFTTRLQSREHFALVYQKRLVMRYVLCPDALASL